ncbi:MAG TPA: alpha/beta fold hydrolase [Anaerolineae bacterium]
MPIFRRVLRWLFLLSGFIVGSVVAIAAVFARRMISPPRQRLWATPADLGLAYEDVHFPAQDGLRLSGWFLPASADSRRKGGTIVLVHGWPWNRLGEAADDLLSNLTGSTPVDLLRLAHALHHDGYHVLMLDLRNHGESASSPPTTFGRDEAKDLLGALAYLNGRDDVDGARIGAVGFSAGANTILYSLTQTNQIKAAIAVQPTSPAIFARRFGADILGPLGRLTLLLAELFYRAAGGPRLGELRPASAATITANTPVLLVQGNGDRWGSMEDVARMAAAIPQARGPLYPDTTHRFEGYQYVIDNPKIVTAFFEQHLPE